MYHDFLVNVSLLQVFLLQNENVSGEAVLYFKLYVQKHSFKTYLG